jgi:hypothetical protein
MPLAELKNSAISAGVAQTRLILGPKILDMKNKEMKNAFILLLALVMKL